MNNSSNGNAITSNCLHQPPSHTFKLILTKILPQLFMPYPWALALSMVLWAMAGLAFGEFNSYPVSGSQQVSDLDLILTTTDDMGTPEVVRQVDINASSAFPQLSSAMAGMSFLAVTIDTVEFTGGKVVHGLFHQISPTSLLKFGVVAVKTALIKIMASRTPLHTC